MAQILPQQFPVSTLKALNPLSLLARGQIAQNPASKSQDLRRLGTGQQLSTYIASTALTPRRYWPGVKMATLH